MSVAKAVSKNVILLPQTNQLIGLYSIIRDQRTKRGDFVFYSDRIIRLLVEEGLNQLPVEEAIIKCHGGYEYKGAKFLGKICGVSIVRAGESMLATGGSAMMAVEVLLARGVKMDRILFLNLLAAPEGIKAFQDKYPDVKIITGGIDEKLDENKYIVPGLGDFGDRYYCI